MKTLISFALLFIHAISSIGILGENLSKDAFKKENDYLKLFNEITNCAIITDKTFEVKNVSIIKDRAVIELQEGKLFKCTPNNSICNFYYFKGKGRFTLTPPSKIEQDQLYRFFEKKDIKHSFSTMLLVITDDSLDGLTTSVAGLSEAEKIILNKGLNNCINHLIEEDNLYCDDGLMKTLLESENNGFFHAHYLTDDNENFAYQIDPTQEEEVSFFKGQSFINHKYYELVNHYSLVDKKIIKNSLKEKYDVLRYVAKVTLDEHNTMNSAVQITFRNQFENQRWLSVVINDDLEIDSVMIKSNKLEFIKGEENSSLWINTDSLELNAVNTLSLYYHGEIFERDLDGWVYLKSPTNWLPTMPENNYASYDITFKYPSKMTLVASGINMENNKIDNIAVSRWVSARDQKSFSFNFGTFKDFSFDKEGMPIITVLHSKYGHDYGATDMEEVVGTDIINSYHFYQEEFGKLNLDHLYVSEIPYYHGQAFPGLIHLSFSTFINNDPRGADMVFRAHEVAHQWWGIGVDYKTYHDQWLSEGFAEYSSLWFLQAAEKNNEKFFDFLSEYKKSIIENRKFLLGDRQEAGPIILGRRTSGKETRGDYGLIIYKKGAWVLHMLRMMMLDLKSMKEDRFKNMMRDFFKKYSGKKATTEDFKKIVDKHLGEDSRWFFDQWIYDTFVPEIDFAYKTTVNNDGKFIVNVKTKVKDAPPSYKLYMPLFIDFGNGQFVRLRIELKGSETEIQLPVLPIEPEEIIFNDLNSVLCTIEEVDWED